LFNGTTVLAFRADSTCQRVLRIQMVNSGIAKSCTQFKLLMEGDRPLLPSIEVSPKDAKNGVGRKTVEAISKIPIAR
jgi:hypothetical protein